MLSLDCHHPDLLDFIHAKSDLDKVTKANISVRVTDDFMQAVEANEDFELSFSRAETGEVITKTVKAREVFFELAKMNWDYAEPGVLFWDRIKDWNLLSYNDEFEYAGTNPCAEEPLPAGGSCLLGSINLSEFVIYPFKKNASFDFDGFRNAVKICVRALNDVLDEGLPLHPLQEQRDSVRDWRQIGLGVMGIADMLIKLGLRYGSEEAINLCSIIGSLMTETAIDCSCDLAQQYGQYPKCSSTGVILSPFFQENSGCAEDIAERALIHGLRNSQLLTIAPTGTLSTMLGVSGGIELIFATSYTRKTESLHNKKGEVYYTVYTPVIAQLMAAKGIAAEADLPDYVVTAQKLDYKERIQMQSVWQKHIDASISSTVNVPHEQLSKSGVCPSFQYKRGKGETLCDGKSCASAIGNVLRSIIRGTKMEELGQEKDKARKQSLCPSCGEPLIYEGGCNICRSCGWSKCD